MLTDTGREPPALAGGQRDVLSRRNRQARASVAELLLVSRLKARCQIGKSDKGDANDQNNLTGEILERAAHIIFVTCSHWFAHVAPRQLPENRRTKPVN